MRHKNVYYTCDRCGEKIKEELNIFDKLQMYMIKNNGIKVTEPSTKYTDDYGMIIKAEGRLITTNYDLCSKCRKEFNKFMKNEKVD